jgi:hypothetical protein
MLLRGLNLALFVFSAANAGVAMATASFVMMIGS